MSTRWRRQQASKPTERKQHRVSDMPVYGDETVADDLHCVSKNGTATINIT